MKTCTLIFLLSILSKGIHGLPVVINETQSSVPAASLLVDPPEQKVPFSLLHPHSLMNSSADCEAFTNGTSPSEFSSPNYPKPYPNNIDCIKIIQAPEGHVVLIQFHDYFHIEGPPLDCPYDYLEMKEGMFGYSPRQDIICGKQPPTMTKSKGRYLWLRFHSDGTVAYKGFRAFVHFLPDPSPKSDFESCIHEIGGIEGEIVSKEGISLDYLRHAQVSHIQVDCTWVIQTDPGRKIFLSMPEYALEHPNDCNYNKVEIYTSFSKLAGKTVDPPTELCGSLQKSSITSDDHVLALRLTTRVGPKSLSDGMKKLSQFKANYTIMRPIDTNNSLPNGKTCTEDEYDCQDNNCIDVSLRCNNKVNCALKNDEQDCPDLKPEGLKADILIISFIGCLLVVGMCTGMFLNIFRKLKQDRAELEALRENNRKSRESGLSDPQNEVKSRTASRQAQEVFGQPPPVSQDSSNESTQTVINNITISTKIDPTTPSPTAMPLVKPSAPLPLFSSRITTPKGRRASSSDIPPTQPSTDVVLYRKPSQLPLQGVKTQTEEDRAVVGMQFVRDCACQTRQSYLMERRRRAPLARGEPTEFVGTPFRRSSRHQYSPGFFFPPSSASSEIGNSLERLDEEFE